MFFEVFIGINLKVLLRWTNQNQLEPINNEFALPEEQMKGHMARFLLRADLYTIQGTSEGLRIGCSSVCDLIHLKETRFCEKR